MLVIEYNKIPNEVWSYIIKFLDRDSIRNFAVMAKLSNIDLSLELFKYTLLQFYYREIPVLKTINYVYNNIDIINSLDDIMKNYSKIYFGLSKSTLSIYDKNYICNSKKNSFLEDYVRYLYTKKKKENKKLHTIYYYIHVYNRNFKDNYSKTFYNKKKLFALIN